MDTKQAESIALLINTIKNKAINTVVLSPGSRNAPLINGFSSFYFNIITAVDERCAAYMALGIVQKKHQPVILACTSGTAVLNYGPAIAEAYYQNIPLLILTADRPTEWLHHAKGQQVQQNNIFKDFTAASYTLNCALPQTVQTVVAEAISVMNLYQRPVHINIPLVEPLYFDIPAIEFTNEQWPEYPSEKVDFTNLLALLNNSKKPIIVVGQNRHTPSVSLSNTLDSVVSMCGIPILAEPLANVHGNMLITNGETLLYRRRFGYADIERFEPDLLITIGTNLLSKQVTTLLNQSSQLNHVHINPYNWFPNSYDKLTCSIPADPTTICKYITNTYKTKDYNWLNLWQEASAEAKLKIETIIGNNTNGELNVLQSMVMAAQGHDLHLGNSLTVRYHQLLQTNSSIECYANRGTGGIDGCISTALGCALVSQRPVIAVTGDLSALYDSNALWQTSLPKGFKLVVFNNGGGSIFTFLPGPKQFPDALPCFVAPHRKSMQPLAQLGNMTYIRSNSTDAGSDFWQTILAMNEPVLIEIESSDIDSSTHLTNIYKQLKEK